MENEYSFDTLLMIGIMKALKERGLISEEDLKQCIDKIECEGTKC